MARKKVPPKINPSKQRVRGGFTVSSSVEADGSIIRVYKIKRKVVSRREQEKAIKQREYNTWKRVADYVSGNLPDQEDGSNILELMHAIDWTIITLSESLDSAQKFVDEARSSVTNIPRVIHDAMEARTQAREIMTWIARPGEDEERDQRAAAAVATHHDRIRTKLEIAGEIHRHFESDNFLDLVAKLAFDCLIQTGHNTVILPNPPPIRICAEPNCARFFAREGKGTFCKDHSGTKMRTGPENAAYQFLLKYLNRKEVTDTGFQKSIDKYFKNGPSWHLLVLIAIKNNKRSGRPGDYMRKFPTWPGAPTMAPSLQNT